MKIEIVEKEGIDQKQFNFFLKNNYSVSSIVPYKGVIKIDADVNEVQKSEITDYYEAMIEGFNSTEYLQKFLKDKYIINSETGKDFVFEMTSKLSVLIQTGQITIQEAENYGVLVEKTTRELNQGYFHSAYFAQIEISPIQEILPLHNETVAYIKDYVNEKYPIQFHID